MYAILAAEMKIVYAKNLMQLTFPKIRQIPLAAQ